MKKKKGLETEEEKKVYDKKQKEVMTERRKLLTEPDRKAYNNKQKEAVKKKRELLTEVESNNTKNLSWGEEKRKIYSRNGIF